MNRKDRKDRKGKEEQKEKQGQGPDKNGVVSDEWEYPCAELSRRIIGAAIEVHRTLGPGLLESTYRSCMIRELQLRDIGTRSEVPIPLVYKGASVECGFRADLIVEESVILELKTVEAFSPIHDAQLLTYLKLCNLKVGLLLNFNATSLRKGIRRLIRSR